MAPIIPVQTNEPNVNAQINKKYISLVGSITALGGLLFGFDLVTISGAIQFLTLHFNLSDYEKGWAVASINLGCIIGSLLAGKLCEIWGRKKTLILCAVLFAITGIGVGLAQTFTWFIIFRLLSGVAVGAAALVCPMYTAEISPAHIRGRMVSFYQLAITMGILLAYLSNYLLLNTGINNWRWMFIAQSAPAFLFLAGLLFVSESPRWLIKKNKEDEALAILTKIGGSNYAKQENGFIKNSFKHEIKERFDDIFKKGMRHILFIGLIIAIFSQAVGQNSIFSYAPEIFKQTGMTDDTAFIQSLIIGIINFLFTFIAISLIDKIGRKTLLKYGAALLFLDAIALAISFYFKLDGFYILVFVLAFIAIYSATIGPVTWVSLSELFPNKIRGSALSACTIALWLANFFTTASFPILKEQLGLPITFLLHGGLCLVYFLFIQQRIPETKEKSLEEIELLLTKKA